MILKGPKSGYSKLLYNPCRSVRDSLAYYCVKLPRWRPRLFGVLLELPVCLALGMVLGESGKGILTSILD